MKSSKENKKKVSKLKRVLGIFRVIIMILLLILAIENGYILWYMLGLMCYGAWLKKDLYKTFFSWYKSALIYYWNRPNLKDNEKPPEFNLGVGLGVDTIRSKSKNSKKKKKK